LGVSVIGFSTLRSTGLDCCARMDAANRQASATHAISGKTRVTRNLIVEAMQRTLESCRPPRQGYNQSRLLRRGETRSRRAVFTNGMRRC
jgi:hypothetical protein